MVLLCRFEVLLMVEQVVGYREDLILGLAYRMAEKFTSL